MAKQYTLIWALAIIVLVSGMFFPKLMDYDAAEYAGISMHMYQTGDWGNIINRAYETGAAFDYLDKPHMLYWSALPGFYIFGQTDAGYRFMSVLLTLVAAFATYRVGRTLYNQIVGQMAAIFFITSQAILLANHDVRTDSLLTSFCILCIAQLVLYLQKKHWRNLVLAGAFLAGAVATKGMIAVLVCGSAVFFQLIAKKNWETLFSWKWIILIASFFLFLSPVLYFYYQQFDLHPEKFVNGSNGNSGVKFILWTQSFERFAGNRSLKDNPEFSFFFHTLLWALLPWSVLCYAGVFNRIKGLIKTRGASFFQQEQLCFAGVWAMFLIMSLSKFKLPHYINVLFPLMCVFTAGYLHQLFTENKEKTLRIFVRFQWVLVVLMVALAILLNIWAFCVNQWWVAIVFTILLGCCIWYYWVEKINPLEKVWLPSAIAVLLFNLLMNTNFYPKINVYQGGSAMATQIKKEKYPMENIYTYGRVVRSFDFYMGFWTPMLTNEQIAQKRNDGKEVLVFASEESKHQLAEKFNVEVMETQPDFHITGLSGQFINPKSRSKSLKQVYLIRVK